MTHCMIAFMWALQLTWLYCKTNVDAVNKDTRSVKNLHTSYLLCSSLFGSSGVHALPLAAGINEGGHYFRYIIPLGTAVIKTPEGVVVGFQIFAWAPK